MTTMQRARVQLAQYGYRGRHRAPSRLALLARGVAGAVLAVAVLLGLAGPADAAPRLVEDGGLVGAEFYAATDYNRNGVVDQEEGFGPGGAPRMGGRMLRLVEVDEDRPDDAWRALLAMGYRGRAGDGATAIYAPADAVALACAGRRAAPTCVLAKVRQR